MNRPNILLVTADDMNWNSVGAYGCKTPDCTPNIDALVVALSLTQSVWAQEPKKPSKEGVVDTAISLLDHFGKQPDTVHEVYRSAYNVLSRREASFADLAGNAPFQELCLKDGITHLGGPMLGCVTPEGASVWIRTLRPASVEVRVMDGKEEKTFGPVKSTVRAAGRR